MNRNLTMFVLCFVTFATSYLLADNSEVEQDEYFSWTTVDHEVTVDLLQPNASLVTSVRDSLNMEPTTAKQAMYKLAVFLRAGMRDEAKLAMEELHRLSPEKGSDDISSNAIYEDVWKRFTSRELAQHLVEVFDETISAEDVTDLLQHFLEGGWSVDEVDAWLAARPRRNWARTRMKFNTEHGQRLRYEQELILAIVGNPDDVPLAITFLYALGDEEVASGDVSWITDLIHPKRPSQAGTLGHLMKKRGHWKEAVDYYRVALALPITKLEFESIMTFGQQAGAPPHRGNWQIRIREGLAECLIKLGQDAEAQRWLEEAAIIHREIGRGTRHVPMTPEERMLEEAKYIKVGESYSSKSPNYQYRRAKFFEKEDQAETEKAYQRGLEFAPTHPLSAKRSKGRTDIRILLLREYVDWLTSENRANEAVALLRKELQDFPITITAATAGQLLAGEFTDHFKVDDPQLWQWLEDHRWAERGPLLELLNKAKDDKFEFYLKNAETLAADNSQRQYALGRVMTVLNESEHAHVYFKVAYDHTEDMYLKCRLAGYMMDAHREDKEWRQAERYLNEIVRISPDYELEISTLYDKFSLIIQTALQAGNKAEVIRLWCRIANADLTHLAHLETIANAGLREELITFYREMQKSLPTSESPKRALELLEQ